MQHHAVWFQIHLILKKKKNKRLKRGRKKNKSINSAIAKLSRWFGFPTYSQCIAVWWSWTADGARTTPEQRNVVRSGQLELWNGIWTHLNGLGSLLFFLLGLFGLTSLNQSGGWPTQFPWPLPCPSTCSNACVWLDGKETEPGN